MLLNLIILFLLVVMLLGIFMFIQRISHNNSIRERVLYAMHIETPEEEIDLSARDYGLRGSARFFYNLREFLTTPKGKWITFLVGALVGGLTVLVTGKSITSFFTYTIVSGGLLLVGITLLLYQHRKEHFFRVKMELPTALETLAAVMEGGSAFESALANLLKESDLKHPLYLDLSIVNEAMQRGRRRGEALKLWAKRSDLVEIADLVSGMIQADQTGGSLGAVMKHHAQALLKENEAEVQRRAERLPIKMLFPMFTMILPAVMAIAAGPSFIRIFQIIEDITSK
ncbi:MAG TPA: type II secretion system F family protein [Methylophilus sp.]|nr:type II secretion system F family protein [Methylophilus sp.]HQQ32941.1 type II secretion system F family protein [Methylophilus sp.]